MHDIFLSYRSSDVELAHWLRDELEALGVSVWADWDQIEGPSAFKLRMSEGLSECLSTIALVTDGYAASPWTTSELRCALGIALLHSGRFPALSCSVMLAAAEPEVLPSACVELLGIGPLPGEGRMSAETRADYRRLHVASLCQMATAKGGLLTLPNALVFPVYRNDLDSTRLLVQLAIEERSKVLATSTDSVGSRIPRLGQNSRSRHMKQIWDWIPALARYGRRGLKATARYIDRFSDLPATDVDSSLLKHPDMRPLRGQIEKAADHLWDNREISLVFDSSVYESEMHAGIIDPVAPFSHSGNCADVLIGTVKSHPYGVRILEPIYRQIRSERKQVNDLFDLSVIAAFVIATEVHQEAMRDFRDVVRYILEPLVNGTTVCDR